jgi:hypothetical protein
MTRGIFVLSAVATALALSATPALAQRSSGGGGESTGGSAVSRGGDGGGSSSGGGGSSSVSSGGASSGPSAATPSRDFVTAPSHPSERGRSRGDGAAGRAVPRSGGAASGGSTSRSAGADAGSGAADSAVPAYSRPRGDRPATGQAVERRTAPPSDGGGGYPYYRGYPYGQYYWPGYGFGLGYYYDPLWYDPMFYGGMAGGYYGSGYYGSGYGNPYGGAQGGYGGGSYAKIGTGSLRLKIKPRDAEVYVDGYFVGKVDEFDGAFQKLELDAGGHRIEIKSEGREVVQFDVLITPGETVTYKGELKSIQ